MASIDWRELYAANQAVIAGARPASGAAPAALLDGLPGLVTQPGVRAGAAPARAALPGVHGSVAPAHAALPGILAGGLGAHGAPVRPRPGLTALRARPRVPGRGGSSVAANAHPGGAGSWDRLEHQAGGRTKASFAYTPPGLSLGTPVPLLVLLHGCTQTAASLASGTRMHELADRHGFVVAYPQQDRQDNAQSCWNWFEPAHQTRDGGEPAFVAGVVEAMQAADERWTLDPARTFVAGLSAGGAMASILAVTHPERFAGVAVHSGLPFGAARDVGSAFAAMGGRGGGDPEAQGRAARNAMGARGRTVPALVIHGTADRTVAPSAGEATVRQWLETNRLASDAGDDPGFAEPAEVIASPAPPAGGRETVRRRWTDGHGRVMVEHLAIDGLGHAWSGGAAGGDYTDPSGPSASEAIADFFALR